MAILHEHEKDKTLEDSQEDDTDEQVQCTLCDKIVTDEDDALECTGCRNWIHLRYHDGITKEIYEMHIANPTLAFFCAICKSENQYAIAEGTNDRNGPKKANEKENEVDRKTSKKTNIDGAPEKTASVQKTALAPITVSLPRTLICYTTTVNMDDASATPPTLTMAATPVIIVYLY